MPGLTIFAGFIALIIILSCIGSYVIGSYILKKKDAENPSKNKKVTQPGIQSLSREQIDEIHARGKITPEEKVKEWESMELCAPGDAIGSASWRCLKFNSCHECLVAYAAELNTEFESFYQNLNFHL